MILTRNLKFSNGNVEWTDYLNPTPEELEAMLAASGEANASNDITASAIADCMDPDHLPKFERWGEKGFLLLRVPAADGQWPYTRKLGIIWSDGNVKTFHRADFPWLGDVQKAADFAQKPVDFQKKAVGSLRASELVVIKIVRTCIQQYEAALLEIESVTEPLESELLDPSNASRSARAFSDTYELRRRIAVLKRNLLYFSESLIQWRNQLEQNAPLAQRTGITDLREQTQALFTHFDELLEDLAQATQTQLAYAAQQTNEAVRIQTILSMFFLPLTLLTGFYGMNLDTLPGARSSESLWLLLGLMLVICVGVYAWLIRRGIVTPKKKILGP